MSEFLPLSSALLKAIAACTSAADAFANDERLAAVHPADDCAPLRAAVRACDTSAELCVALVIKFFRTKSAYFTLLRVLSGKLKRGTFFCLCFELL